MRCEGDSPTTGTGEFVYAGDTYTGTMKMTTGRGGEPMTMTMKYAGKRLGDSTKHPKRLAGVVVNGLICLQNFVRRALAGPQSWICCGRGPYARARDRANTAIFSVGMPCC